MNAIGGSQEQKELEMPNFSKVQIIKNVVVLSMGFLIFYTAYDALSMLQSTINIENGIGTATMATVYATFCLSTLLLPKFIIQKLGCKTTLLLAMLLSVPFLVANFYPHWNTMILAAVLNGIGAGVLWGSQCTYLNEMAFMYAQISEIPHEEKREKSNIVNCESRPTDSGIYSITFNGRVKAEKDDEAMNKNQFTQNLKECFPSASGFYVKKECIADDTSYKNPEVSVKFKEEENSSNSVMLTPGQNCKQFTKRNNFANPTSTWNIQSTTARFFGFHGLAYLSTKALSNLLSFYVLKQDSLIKNITLNTSCTCGADFCNVDSACFENNLAQPSQEIRYILTGICVAMSLMSVMLLALLMDPLRDDKKSVQFSLDLLMATCKLAKKKQQLFLIPLAFYVGMVLGFYSGDFTKSYVACAWGTYHVSLVSVCYGTMCALSSTFSGCLVKQLGRLSIFLAAAVVNIAAIVFLLLWNPDANHAVMFFVAAGMLATATGTIYSQLKAYYGILFKADEEAAFAAFYLWYSLGYCLSFAYSNYFCTYMKIYLLLAISTAGIIGYVTVECILMRNKRN